MKHNTQKQQAGVWLDGEKAMIIASGADSENSDYQILEKVKLSASFSGGNEHTINNAKQGDSLKYFKAVSTHLAGYDEILIFGPGKSQEQFQHHLQNDAQFKSKKITIQAAEHLTDPQMIAKVRDFFSSNHS